MHEERSGGRRDRGESEEWAYSLCPNRTTPYRPQSTLPTHFERHTTAMSMEKSPSLVTVSYLRSRPMPLSS